MKALARWLPGLAQLFPYPQGALRGDVLAGLAVCVVMVPSVLAYAELAGLRAETGLYAALGAMTVFALFTTSRRVITGPDTTIALLAASVIVPLASGDPARAATIAASLAILTGVLLVVAGKLRFGNVADLLSTPVLVGYAVGAALILIGTQLPVLLGVKLPRDAFFLRVIDAFAAVPLANPYTVTLGVALIALMLASARLAPRAPAALIACLAAIAASVALDLPSRDVVHLAHIDASIPLPSLPAIAWRDLQALAPGALALALLVFAEGILMARTLAAKYREPLDPDQELVALGAANAAAGLVNGFPVGASTSRSVTADASGAQTQLTQWIAAALLALFVLFVARWLVYLPRVALAAILVTAGIRLIDVGEWRRLARLDRRAVALAAGVALAVLVLGVLPGVLIGVALSIARVLIETARPRDAILRRLASDHRFHDLDEDQPGASVPGVLVYRLYAPILFANARYVADRLRELIAQSDAPVKCLVLDLQAVTQIDVTALGILRDFYDELEGRGIDVRFARANRPLREQLVRWIGAEELRREPFFPSASAAVDDFLER